MTGYMCSAPIYKYGKWVFEYGMFELWPVKKDGTPYKRAGKKFYNDINLFLKMEYTEKQEYRIGGGCQIF